MNKKVSIITINYNNKEGLEKTMLSVLNQKSTDYEYIVIDGNSNDGSKEVISNYSQKLKYWVSEPDFGIYNAMNKGIKVAQGDYLLFLNSGDVLIDDAEILIKCQEKLHDDIVAFDCLLSKENKIVGKRTHQEKLNLYYVYKNGLKHQSTFIKKRMFDNFGLYNEQYKIASDYEFWIRCFLQSSTKGIGIPITMANFELGGISQNSNWGEEHRSIENEWLPNIIDDFKKLEELEHLKRFKFLITILKKIHSFKKLFK